MVVYRLRRKAVIEDGMTRRDNGGRWWTAVCRKHISEVHRAFREERVAGVLYDAVGRIVPTKETYEGLKVIKIQIRYPQDRLGVYYTNVCLSELGVGLLDAVPDSNR